MGKWKVCAVFLIAIAAMPLQPAAGETAAQRRMSRVLSGRSEPARLKIVAMLRMNPSLLYENMDVVTSATQQLLDSFESDQGDSDGGDNATPKRPAKSSVVPDSVNQLLAMLAASPNEDARSTVIDAIEHSDGRISMIAMDLVGRHELRDAVDSLQDQIMRSEFEDQYAYRFTLVRTLAQLHCPRSIEIMHQLHSQLRGQLRHEIANRLADVDLRDFDGNRKAYAEYLEQHPADSLVRPVSFVDGNVAGNLAMNGDATMSEKLTLHDVSSESTGGLKLSKSHYYGINLNAGRMLFVIDRSGSMKHPTRYDTRLQNAKRELIRVIDDLPPEAEFSIMLFDTRVQAWKKELLPATPQNKREAIAFVERIALGDKTNTHGVLSDALEFDDQLEVVFVLTDGQPTFGKLTHPDAILRDIVGRNRMRHLKFHTIGVGVNPLTEEFLKELSEQTGGEFREVD
ncbi:MAG: VWA domain-containing protein [Rhodopirellula sp. JB044]|uniref:VWA domain-containing protein n=1 Tax=Rhodopirellula sp. JB044 TaxID=3342844 RepID=UPI00370C7EBF